MDNLLYTKFYKPAIAQSYPIRKDKIAKYETIFSNGKLIVKSIKAKTF